MGKIEGIEQAVEQLTQEDRERLREFLDEIEERAFDEALEREAKLGKLDKIAEAAHTDLRTGDGGEF